MNILEANNIVKRFTPHTALDNVSLHVPEGMIYGLLGPNGAGKTTLIRIINHITAPDSGEVLFDGHHLTADDVSNIGYLPEERGLYKKMEVGEQAIFFARLKGMTRHDATTQLKAWFERLEIGDWWKKKVQELSKGMAQKVQFIITVLHKPRLLIFDEPFSGFDPINANILKNEILELSKQGSTVIFSTHNMSSVEELCQRITLINRSHDIHTGDVIDLRKQYGGNRMSLTYRGDTDALCKAIAPMVSLCTVSTPDRDRNLRINIDLTSSMARRDLISTANSVVDLVGFEQLLPSMDEIFISAVANSNLQSQQND